MPQQKPKITQTKKTQVITALIKGHKALTIVTLTVIFLSATFGYIYWRNYAQKLSDRDYSALSTNGEEIIKELGGLIS